MPCASITTPWPTPQWPHEAPRAHDRRETHTMHTSSLVVDKARELAAAGHHAAVVEYLGAREVSELEDSPSVALLYGTAQARLGHHDEGLRWLDLALDQARKQDEQAVERHALNARGAVALVSGRVDEAADYFTQALMVASRDGDLATTGRCSNNLGIISNLRGRHAEAIGSWEIAVAAFERAGLPQGVAECYHNLGITYREQGALDRARAEADRAVAEAEAAGDRTLYAVALRGRAEIRVCRGELELARRELDRVREIRSSLSDPVAETEDRRVAASVLAADRQLPAAERALREVIRRAESHKRPYLLAEATRDLAMVLRQAGRTAEAKPAARTAKAVFAELGAEGEIRNLARHWDDAFAAELRGSLAPLHAAQELADAGRYAELLTYLGGRSHEELEQSPMLALLCGIGHSRLGRLEAGQRWASVALSRARVLGDRTVEVRGLNVCGAIALERGGISEAARLGGRRLKAPALAGRAEIQAVRGEPELAIREAERALVVHRELKDAVLETEALRILAVALGIAGSTRDAEGMLREVIERATEHGRPLLVAIAQRDLAQLLAREGEVAAAKQLALTARAAFDRLGAKAEIRKLGALLGREANPGRLIPPQREGAPQHREGR